MDAPATGGERRVFRPGNLITEQRVSRPECHHENTRIFSACRICNDAFKINFGDRTFIAQGI